MSKPFSLCLHSFLSISFSLPFSLYFTLSLSLLSFLLSYSLLSLSLSTAYFPSFSFLLCISLGNNEWIFKTVRFHKKLWIEDVKSFVFTFLQRWWNEWSFHFRSKKFIFQKPCRCCCWCWCFVPHRVIKVKVKLRILNDGRRPQDSFLHLQRNKFWRIPPSMIP
jgi:hypothetical protein